MAKVFRFIQRLWITCRKLWKRGRCESCGATKGLVDCWLVNYETGKEQHWTYCVDCAPKQGFCWACGQFWGGVESFDFGPGYCENCASEIEEEEEYYKDEGYYPDEYEGEVEEL